MITKTDPPWYLPDQVQRSLFQADYTLKSFHGIQGLVSKTDFFVALFRLAVGTCEECIGLCHQKDFPWRVSSFHSDLASGGGGCNEDERLFSFSR